MNFTGGGGNGADDDGNGGGGGGGGNGADDDGNGGGGGGGNGADDDGNGGGGGGNGADDDGNGGGGGGGDDDGYRYGDDDPVSNFNVAECDTYGSLWMWDLSLTCEDVNTLDNCECTFASELMDMGMLSCDDVSQCPNDCAVCLTCMRILGCSVGSTPVGAGTVMGVSNVAFYIIAAAIGTLAISGVAYAAHRNGRDDNSLGEHLVDAQLGINSLDSGMGPQVYLAPTTPAGSDPMLDIAPPVQFEAAALAAAASQDDDSSLESDVWLAPVVSAEE